MEDINLKSCPFCNSKNLRLPRLFSIDKKVFMDCITHVECIDCGATGPKIAMVENVVDAWNMKIKHTSLKESTDILLEGIINTYKECPDASNKTFEEIANWAGQHILLTKEKKE